MLIRVVAIADFHGQLSRAARLAAAIADLRVGHHSMVIGVGDLVGWSQVESALTDDAFALEALDAMGVTLSTIGNHELDKGIPRFRQAEIETMFRQQWPGDPPAPRPTLGVSHNVAYVRDPGRAIVPDGARAELFRVDGRPLNRSRTYRVVMNSTLARGIEDYFPVFTGIGLDRRYDTEVPARDALAEYLDRYAPGPDGLTGRMPSPAEVLPGQFDLPDAGEPKTRPS